MTFQPIIPFGGFTGWALLKRTMPAQQAAQQASPQAKRDEAYFREKIGSIDTAAQLVADRRLLSVALTAYGLEGDINNKAFIQKILEGGTLTEGSLANRLANKQYQNLSSAFGFGDFATPRNKISDFPDKVLSLYRTRQFETAVGAQNNDFRIALNAEREVKALAGTSSSETVKWLTVLGNPPLRQAFQTALGLPSSFASIDLDRQLTVMQAKARTVFGNDSISQFSDPEKLDKLVRTYVIRAETSAIVGGVSSGSTALQLLSTLRR
jgi:hypothetical protein